MYYQTQNSVR